MMGPGPRRKLSLPAHLVQELEAREPGSNTGNRRRQQPSRKDVRKAQRIQKKQPGKARPQNAPSRQKVAQEHTSRQRKSVAPATADDDSEDESEGENDGLGEVEGWEEDSTGSEPGEDSHDSGDTNADRPTGSAKRKLAEDDAEIAKLERKLGLKKGSKSLSTTFDDGLGGLLGDLDAVEDDSDQALEGFETRKRKAEADAWLAHKRQKAQAAASVAPKVPVSGAASRSSDVHGEDPDLDEFTLNEMNNGEEESDDESDNKDEDSAFGGFSDAEDPGPEPDRPQRENPYVAPSTGVAKYVPPSLRKPHTSPSNESEAQLRRRVQGLMNRLTSDNMVGITKDVLALYSSNPRQLVTSTLADTFLTLVCSPEKRPDAFFVMMAGFVTAIHRTTGMAVAAHFIQQLVRSLGDHHRNASGSQSDAPSKHLVTLLAELYNMQVISCVLVFDYVRLFLNDLSELNTELLLRIVQHCGPSLRREDPHSLSDIIRQIRPASLQNISVRTSFMIDEMKKLQSNKTKAVTRNRDLADQRAQAKKRIGTLAGASDVQPFRIGLGDIESADKNGKWWLVGASWSGAGDKALGTTAITSDGGLQAGVEADKDDDDYFTYLDIDFWQLAKEQGFNTEVRQRIFVALHTATDYEHAELLIRNLRLNKHQKKEIAEVVVRSGERQSEYNHYYTLVASKFCGYKELAFQFRRSLTVRFGKMGEDTDSGEGVGYDLDDTAEYDMRYLYNAAKMYGSLAARGSLRLGDILKYRNLTQLQERAHMFVEVLLMTVLQEAKAEALESAIASTDLNVARGVQYFIKKHLRKTDLLQEGKEKKALKRACQVADSILQARLTADDAVVD